METYHELLIDVISGKNDNSSAMNLLILVKQAILCVLHMENRCGEKILKMLLINAMESLKTQPKQVITKFIEDIENKINTDILGSPYKPSQWMIPTDKSKHGIVGSIAKDNRSTRRIINHLQCLIDIAVQYPTLNVKWKAA